MNETSPAVQPIAGGKLPLDKHVLRATALSRTFIDGDRRLEVLRKVDFVLERGEVCALTGRSGSGKSTLLHLLGLLDKPDAGEIFIEGIATTAQSETERSWHRCGKIGFVFQHYFLLPEFNVLENVLMPMEIGGNGWGLTNEQTIARGSELLAAVGLQAQARQFPKTLSGGERQRVAVARALLLNPRILLCDEPTGNLDPATGTHIMNLIFELSRKQNTSVLVVTHDVALAARADRILRLEDGRLIQEK